MRLSWFLATIFTWIQDDPAHTTPCSQLRISRKIHVCNLFNFVHNCKVTLCFSYDESGKNCYLMYESLGIFIREIPSQGSWKWGWASDVRGTSGKCGHWGMGKKLWAGQWGTWRKVWGKSSLYVAVCLTVHCHENELFSPPSFSSSCLRIFILAAICDILFAPCPHFMSHIVWFDAVGWSRELKHFCTYMLLYDRWCILNIF